MSKEKEVEKEEEEEENWERSQSCEKEVVMRFQQKAGVRTIKAAEG